MDQEPLREARPGEIGAINAVVEAAVMGWDLPERVKRLSVATLKYSRFDLDHFRLCVAETPDGGIAGVAAWAPADAKDLPPATRGLLLHGIYVDPARQHGGLGARLLQRARSAAAEGGYDGLLVKAQPGAEGFFRKQGMVKLPVRDPARDYPHRYWLALN